MKASAAPLPRLVDDRQGSARLGISRSQFRALVASGIIPRVEIPNEHGQTLRRLLVDVADLDRLIERWKRTTV